MHGRPRRTALVGIALAVLVLGSLPAVGATHTGPLFERSFQWWPTLHEVNRFEVPSPDADHQAVCYERVSTTALRGSWTAVVTDTLGNPVVVDAVARWGPGPLEGVSVAVPLPVGFTGIWKIQTDGVGYSPRVDVRITFVASPTDCTV